MDLTILYTYDARGNIVSYTTYEYSAYTNDFDTSTAYTYSYTYGNSGYKDLLTDFNGAEITYDDSFNPLTWGLNTTLTWTQGRRLASYTKGSKSTAYTYDENGIRTAKSGARNTEYIVVDGTYLGERTTIGSTEYLITYLYGDSGVIGIERNGSRYYFVKNLQGDVTALMTTDGTIVANYAYDAYGNVISVTNRTGSAITSPINIANMNPFRYRGYMYDQETGFYYVSSRYYDPEIGRWINADDSDILGLEPGSLLHYNLFAYCWNNPVNMTDDNGYLPWFVAAAVGGALFDTAAYLIGSAISGQKITWAGVGKAALTGAVTGVAFGALGKGVKALTTAAKATKVGVKIGATFGKMGKLVKYRKIAVNWDIITRHGLKRMSERGMSKSLINSVIKNGKLLQQTTNKFAYISKKGVVIIESNGKIVTAYSNKFFDETIKGYVKQLFG